jgi:hypothetical protein
VCDIFITALEKNQSEYSSLLDSTSLLQRILEISGNSAYYTFKSERKVNNGYMAFIRKIANKIVEIQKKNDEVTMILESNPDWRTYYETDLKVINELESKPLGNDPRKKAPTNNNDDELEFFFKIKNFSNNKLKTKDASGGEDKKEEGDENEEEEEELDFEQS